jgi:hypothetical protein
MTIYDLAFFPLFFGTLGLLLIGAAARPLYGVRISRFIFRGLGLFAVAYVGIWMALTAFSKQRPIGVGDPQCIDSWCIAVEKVDSTPQDATTVYDVTLCIFSRAETTPTSYGAHAASDEKSDVYLVDDRGRRYDSRPHPSEVPLDVTLKPGEAVRTRRVFELPSDARGLGILSAGGSLGMCPMIGECSTSHSASDYALARGVYRKGSSFLALVNDLKMSAQAKPPQWR